MVPPISINGASASLPALPASSFSFSTRSEVIEEELDEELAEICDTTLRLPTNPDSTDEVMMADLIMQADDDDEMDTEVEVSNILVHWILPVSFCVFVTLNVLIQLQENIQSHKSVLNDLRFQAVHVFPPPTVERVLHHAFGKVHFGPRELSIMQSPTARLNDICLNGIASLLYHHFSQQTMPTYDSSRRCALFTTFDLPMIQYNASDQELWRRTHHLEYWNRALWILPIHRARSEHWVMCTIIPAIREIHLFDSFSTHDSWKHEVKVRPVITY